MHGLTKIYALANPVITPLKPSTPPLTRPPTRTIDHQAPDNGLTHQEMTKPDALRDAAEFVAGVGPWKGSLWTVEEVPAQQTGCGSEPGAVCAGTGTTASSSTSTSTSSSSPSHQGLSADDAADAKARAAAGAAPAPTRLVSTGLTALLKSFGFQIHPYTLRDEAQFVPGPLGGSVDAELGVLFDDEGVDGIFADYPLTAVKWLDARAAATAGLVGPQAEGDASAADERAAGGAPAAAHDKLSAPVAAPRQAHPVYQKLSRWMASWDLSSAVAAFATSATSSLD
jgi:hypothetical protein